MRLTAAFVLLATGLLAACEDKPPTDPAANNSPGPPASVGTAAPAPTPPPVHARSLPKQLPALYVGTLPCTDCEALRYELDLRADSVYFLRQSYLGRNPPTVVDDIGQWSISDANVLELRGGGDKPRLFLVKDERTLEDPDVHAHLVRQDTYAAIAPGLAMRGMYRYMADAALFEECLTGLKLPVAAEGDNAALQTEYVKVRKQADQVMLVNLEGRIVRQPGLEGGELRDTLVVDRTGRFFPSESCGARGVTHELESTRWVLVRLGEESVQSAGGQREPYIALEPTEHRISGHGGCNRLVGGYQLNGSELKFTQLALTRMACPDMKYEDAFAKALNATANWKITGNHLELFDATSTPVARFEERNL
ncbi:MAG TPA: META domain-containing protein [Povalibacter sp.]